MTPSCQISTSFSFGHPCLQGAEEELLFGGKLVKIHNPFRKKRACIIFWQKIQLLLPKDDASLFGSAETERKTKQI
jgi:hypothetical protein